MYVRYVVLCKHAVKVCALILMKNEFLICYYFFISDASSKVTNVINGFTSSVSSSRTFSL